jgi:putative transposase
LLKPWAETRGIRIEYIQPGQPQQSAYIERYNRTVRHEWLDQNIFERDCCINWLVWPFSCF